MTDLREAAKQMLDAIERGESFDYLENVAAPALRAALEGGCDHCLHPLYAGIRCGVCGRWTDKAK